MRQQLGHQTQLVQLGSLTSELHTAYGVFGDEVKSVSVMEGDSLTLHTHLTEIQRHDLILWKFGPQETLIARINKEANTVSIYADVFNGRFRDSLKLNDQTGSLIITNITSQHTGLYQMTISNKQKTSYRFNVTVYARLPIPVISRISLQNSSERSNCSFMCSVLNVSDVSLSWYKGNSLLSSISVSDLNNNSISLHLECLDDSYSCVLNNTISNQTQHLNTDLCQPCSAECASPLLNSGNDHRILHQHLDGHSDDKDKTLQSQQLLFTDTAQAESCPQTSLQLDCESTPKDISVDNDQRNDNTPSQPSGTPESQLMSSHSLSLSPTSPLLWFSEKMEKLVFAGTKLSHSIAASPQISTKKRRAPQPPKPSGPARPPPPSERALRPLPQRQGSHQPSSANSTDN
ncbi:uncharacterized protein [Misgurnus anguillicaudatus]|uniref:uncharacterized protein n=1 Tax=Misgurnus anguillicaudatus TaxID=75329 RepID=UPI003CCF2FF8